MNQDRMNRKLLTDIFPEYADSDSQEKAVAETEKLFHSLGGLRKIPRVKRIFLKRFLLVTVKKDNHFDAPVCIAADGSLWPTWKKVLNEHMELLGGRTKTVSLLDYGAVGDGVTDCTSAFIQAIGSGGKRVVIPPGTYVTRGIRLPSNTELIGSGSNNTKLVLHEKAPKKERLITNHNYLLGNHHIRIQGLSLDWNISRLKLSKKEKSATGGTHSSGITLAHVRYAMVQDIKIKNAGLHGVDVTSAFYSYLGDGTRSCLGSQYVWVDQVEATGFGDDGITTHHSECIHISNSYLHHPSGKAHKKGFSNSNGIEVDDGSQHVTLTNNRTAYCFGGVEIKAHANSSAASDTQIVGHYSEHDNRAYNFRHIGHHKGNNADSRSAVGIRATYLVAIHPQKTDLYLVSTPRAMVISAYQKVAIHHFFAETDREENSDKIGVAVQYRAGEVILSDVNLINYANSTHPIKISKDTGRVQMM